ncbi:MAG TPA: hypothetical protein VFV07_12340 [Rhizomicrobium sp.]|nr:hypothetical protein [Rhizomicrobium sp.]
MGRHAVVVLMIVLTSTAARAGFVQDQAHYEQAVRDKTSAPYFVLVTLVDDTMKTSWTGCTLPAFVEGALDVEQGLANDDADMARDAQAMLVAKDHTFHFSNPKALAEIRMDAYAPSDLERARGYLHAHGTAFLLSSDWTKIDAANALNRTALACAIIEKGLAARMADGNGETYAEP